MARRRANMPIYDSEDDDEPVGRRAKAGAASAAAASQAAAASSSAAKAASAAPPASAQPKKSSRKPSPDPSPPPSPKRTGGRAIPLSTKRAGPALVALEPELDPDEEQILAEEGDEEKSNDGGGQSNGSSGGHGGSESSGPGWQWVTAKFFSQDEHILERWAALVAEDVVPDAAVADLNDVTDFKALCLKNAKWIRGGIAFEQRPNVWELLSGSRVYGGRLENPLNYYRSLVKQSANIPSKQRKDIKADVPRTMQEHQKFKTKAAQAEMDRILSAYCVRNPTVGYCQSMSHVVGFLMLFYGEESCFWFLCTLIDQYLPDQFFAPSLLGVRVETEVFALLVADKLSKLSKHLLKHDVDIKIVSLRWFLCMFLLTFPMETAARVWDVMLLEGSYSLFNFGLALLELHKEQLLKLHETSHLLDALSHLGSDLDDADLLVKKAFGTFGVKEKEVVKLRMQCRPPLEKEYVAQLQTMESRRENEERARRKAEVVRLKAERAEELALELGTSVTKVPHNAFGFASVFSARSRPRPVTLKLFHIRPPKKTRQEREAGAAEASGRGDDGDGHHEAEEAKKAQANGSAAAPVADEWYIIWEPSTRKSELQRTIHLNEAQLIFGGNAGVFAANPKVSARYAATPDDAKRCASFLIPSNPGIGRRSTSFDVVFDSAFDVDAWCKVLKRSNILKIKMATMGQAVTGATAAAKKAAAAAATPAAAAPEPKKNGRPQPLRFEDDAAPAPAAAAPAAAASSYSPPPPISAAAFDSPSGADPPPKSRRGKSRKAPVIEDEDEEPEPVAAAPKQRRVMRRPKDEEEADELDVREF